MADGYHLDHCSLKLPYGGAQITEILAKLLLEKGYGPYLSGNINNVNNTNNGMNVEPISLQNSLTDQKLHIIRQIKECYGYVNLRPKINSNSLTIASEIKRPLSTSFQFLRTSSNSLHTNEEINSSTPIVSYTLPDGTLIKLENELYNCVEKYFTPRYFDQMLACEADEPIQKAVFRCVMNCGMDIRKSLLNNIVLAGGSTTFRGFEKRFSIEMKQTVPAGMSSSVRIKALPDRAHSVWLGGAILANMSTFDERWITAIDYDEIGANIVHKRCPIYL